MRLPTLSPIDRWNSHVREWRDCRGCELCDQRHRIVLGRGVVPCDALFVGEAPGESEDLLGEPFVGPAGKKLDDLISEALNNTGCARDSGGVNPDGSPINIWVPADIRLCFTNLVACFPAEAKQTDDHRPPESAVRACAPRVAQLVGIASPRLIVSVGATSKEWLHLSVDEASDRWDIIEVVHPAWLLRQREPKRGSEIRHAVRTLTAAFRKLVG